MTDKTTLPGTLEKPTKPAQDAALEDITSKADGAVLDHRRDIFDKRFTAIMEVFGEACAEQGVTVALAIAFHPDDEHPMVFLRGHQFDAASLGARVIRHLQDRLMKELSGEAYGEDA